MNPPVTLTFSPLPLCLPAPRPVLRRWRVEYRWTHKGSLQAGRTVLEVLALGQEEARGMALRVVEEATKVLGQAAYRVEIGEVAA